MNVSKTYTEKLKLTGSSDGGKVAAAILTLTDALANCTQDIRVEFDDSGNKPFNVNIGTDPHTNPVRIGRV